MDVYVIWGFLGSGKTTLINYLLSNQLKDKQVVVLENESGDESVDGIYLQSQQFNVVDLKAGCVCCTLRLKLVDLLDDIRQRFHPDIVLIEPSGLASLEDLFQIPALSLKGVISLLDVTLYDFLMKLNSAFYHRQFHISSLLFLTKTELANDGKVEQVTEELLTLHPQLLIVNDYRRIDEKMWDHIWRIVHRQQLLFFPVQKKIPMPEYAMQTIELISPLDISFFETSFQEINRLFGSQIIRAKGLLQIDKNLWYRFDAVGDSSSWDIVPDIEYEGKSFLSIWWNKADKVSPVEWFYAFLNAEEVDCSVRELAVTNEELFNYMGYKESKPDSFILDFIHTLKLEALSICRPRIGFRFLTGKEKDKCHLEIGRKLFRTGLKISGILQDADFYVTMVSSVGEELDMWIREKRNSSDVMVAYIADILGSVLAESVVAYGQSLLERRMQRWNLNVSNAYSPGYCDWDISQQQLFFSMLPSGFCGITLTKSCMMLPLKSVSSLIAVGKEIEKKPYGCAICRNKNCFKRRKNSI